MLFLLSYDLFFMMFEKKINVKSTLKNGYKIGVQILNLMSGFSLIEIL